MKTALIIILLSTVSFTLFGQSNKADGYRFSSLKDAENQKDQLYSAEDSSDLLLQIYDAVLFNRLDISIDTSLLGNQLKWSEVQQTQHFFSRESGEIIHTIEKIDYLTYSWQSDVPLVDGNGDPVIRTNEDGFEEYVYPPRVEAPLSAKDYFEIRILERGKYNSNKKQWEYSVEKIGIDQFTMPWKNIVWVDIKELKKVIKNWKDYPLLASLESGNISLVPYKQTGPNHRLNDDDYLVKRTLLKNMAGNELLFEENNCDESSSSFLDVIFSNANVYTHNKKINTKMCVNNQNWQIPYVSNDFKKIVPLSFPRDDVRCPILVFSQKDSMFNNAHHIERIAKRAEMPSETYYEVMLYIKPSEIKELRIEEVKIKYPDGTLSEFKVKSVAFVIEYEGVNREIFSVKLADLALDNQNQEWYNFIINRNFVGEQYWQSAEERRRRY